MKHIKTYEGLFQKVKEFFYDAKLAKAFERFLNSIEPYLGVVIKADRTSVGGYNIYSGVKMLIHIKTYGNTQSITIFRKYFRENGDLGEDVGFLPQVANYIMSIGNSKIITFDVRNEDVPNFISKLTVKDFNLYKEITKFNL